MRLLTLIAILCSYLWTNSAIAETTKAEACFAATNIAVAARAEVLRGARPEALYALADAYGEVGTSEIMRNAITWGIYYQGNSEQFLQSQFFRTCMDNPTGPVDMSGPER